MSTFVLSKELINELGASIRGNIYPRDDPNFGEYTLMFNGNVRTTGLAVVCPLDAEDVSKIIVFCKTHALSPSVKAGGFGTAGWAVGGDIVIDLSRITDIDIEVPDNNGSYTSLRNMAPLHSKGKQKIVVSESPTSRPGKRRRETDTELRTYGSASFVVDTFLSNSDFPPPNVRRRISNEVFPSTSSSQTTTNSTTTPVLQHYRTVYVNGSDNEQGPPERNIGANFQVSLLNDEIQVSVANASFPQGLHIDDASAAQTLPDASGARFNADPFGYIDGSNQNMGLRPTTTRVSSSWTTAPTTVPRIPSLPHTIPSQLQPIHKHAFVTFGAGMRQKEIDIYTANHPLDATSITGDDSTIPYHVPFAAHPVGSSIMILGGFGFLSRLHGLSIDNLVEAEMVLADGRIVIVNENEHPDLWWAMRGAGPAFGIVTRYKAKAFPVPVVFAGNLIYRFHKATAPSLIKHFRDCIKGAPRELYANVFLTAGPEDKDSLVVIQMCYIGPKENGQEYLQAIASWDGEKCLLNEVNEKSFLHQQDSVAQVLRGKAGRQWFIRSALITSLPDDVIHQTVLRFDNTPVGCTWLFELAGGAIADYEDTCVPKPQREALFTVAALHQWDMGINDPRCITTAEKWIAETLKPVQTGGPYPSFLGRHESPERTISSFGQSWSRMCEIKQKYDPNNMFSNSLWPLNSEGQAVEARTHEPPSPSGHTNMLTSLEMAKAGGQQMH